MLEIPNPHFLIIKNAFALQQDMIIVNISRKKLNSQTPRWRAACLINYEIHATLGSHIHATTFSRFTWTTLLLFQYDNKTGSTGVKKKEIGFILAEKFLWKDGDVDVVPHGNRILLRPWFVLVIDHDPSVALIHYGSTPRSQCDPYSSQ